MRHRQIVIAAGLLMGMAGASTLVGAKEKHMRVDDFSWSDDGAALALHSQDANGVIVTRAEPASFHGLRRGDVILAVDGKPVRQVEGITRALRGRTTPVALRVRHGSAETTLVWSRADYRMFAQPPAPPAPHN